MTGRPAAGKSTLAKWLAKELKLPIISKDSIREVLFDQLGWQDRDWAKRLGRVSIDLMFYFAQTQLESGRSIIILQYLPFVQFSRICHREIYVTFIG